MANERAKFEAKFIGYLVTDICWTALIAGGLYRTEQIAVGSNPGVAAGLISLLMVMVVVKGFISTGWLLGQHYVDRYTQVAEIVYRGGGSAGGKPPAAPDPPTGL